MTLPDPTPPSDSLSTGGRLVSTDGRSLPLRGAELHAEAGGGIARVRLTQRFHNPHAEPLTVRYLLPLPSDGAVSGYSFVLDGRRIVGTIDRKQAAREQFELALVEGRSAALLEQTRTSVFDQEIGNIPPGAELVAQIIVDQPLKWLEEGAWEWRFPTVIGPRFMGAPGQVEDARDVVVELAREGVDARAALELLITDAPEGTPESTSHALRWELERGGGVRARFDAEAGVALDRDVVVRWPLAQPKVGVSVLAARPERELHGGDSFALVTLVPPAHSADTRAMPRDLSFLIDTSGSMHGRPLEQAKRVMAAMIETLGGHDRIDMIEFGSKPKRFRRQPILADEEGKRAAQTWVAGLAAQGGTQMHDALLEALRPLRADAQRQIVLLTDGQIGFERQIIEALVERLPEGVRLHTVGVGAAINRSLTADAARAGRGTELIVDLDEDVERVLPRLLAKTCAPLITDLRIEGPSVSEAAPFALPDLYAGAPALLPVRVREPGTITIRGRVAQGEFVQRVEIPALALGEGPEQVTTLFGRELVADTELARAASGDARGLELDALIEGYGLEFCIATRLTSWIAVSETVTVDPRAKGLKQEQPHALAYGSSIEGLGLREVFGGGSFDTDTATLPMARQRSAGFGGPPSGLPRHVEARRNPGLWIALLILLLMIAGLIWARCGYTPAEVSPDQDTTQSEVRGAADDKTSRASEVPLR